MGFKIRRFKEPAFMAEVLETPLVKRERVRTRSVERGDNLQCQW